jgi:peroxiredoxin
MKSQLRWPVLTAFSLAAVCLIAAPWAAAGDEEMGPAVKVGDKAPEFALADTDGKEHKLSDYTGKTVILHWFNPGCPFIKLHYEKQTTMVDMWKDYQDKDVVILAVNSTHSGHPDFGKDAEAKSGWKIAFPILADADGKVGMMYGAKTTPHMFVIDKTGVIRYAGAIDNDPRNEKSGEEKINYVRNAVDALLAGSEVEKTEVKPYGCGVKYKG